MHRPHPDVVIHWRDADEEGTVCARTDHSVEISVLGDDAPFVFDHIERDHWRERDHGRDVRMTFRETQSGGTPC